MFLSRIPINRLWTFILGSLDALTVGQATEFFATGPRLFRP